MPAYLFNYWSQGSNVFHFCHTSDVLLGNKILHAIFPYVCHTLKITDSEFCFHLVLEMINTNKLFSLVMISNYSICHTFCGGACFRENFVLYSSIYHFNSERNGKGIQSLQTLIRDPKVDFVHFYFFSVLATVSRKWFVIVNGHLKKKDICCVEIGNDQKH